MLSRDSVPSPSGKRAWRSGAIADLAHNPAYTGRAVAYRWRMEKRDGTRRMVPRSADEHIELPHGIVPAIVDAETFAAAQAILTANKSRLARRTKSRYDFLLTGGFARCGYCGGALYGELEHGRRPTYRCRANNHVQDRCVHTPRIQGEALEEATWRHAERILTRPEIIAAEVARLRSHDDTADNLRVLDRAVAEIERKQRNTARAIAALDDDDAEPLTREMAALGTEKRQLLTERQRVLQRRTEWEMTQARLYEIETWRQSVVAEMATLDITTKRLALQALGVEVRVWKADHEPRYEITASVPGDSGGPGGGVGRQLSDTASGTAIRRQSRARRHASPSASWTTS